MKLRVSWILLFVTALVALGVAACGDDDGGATPTPSPTPEASKTPLPFDATPTPTPPPATTEAGMEVGEFVIKPDITRARPGTVVFKVRNTGAVTHQFLVIRSDLPIAQLPRKTGDTGVDETQVEIVGRIESIAPGGEEEVSVPVETGKYVLICNLYAGGVSHYLSGEYRAFEVTPSAPAPATPEGTPETPSPAP